MTESEVLARLNELIRLEHGKKVTMQDTLMDAELDSFGISVLFMDLDDEFKYFSDVPEGVDPFGTIDFTVITIREVVEKCM